MELTFKIEYRTAWGESLGVILEQASAANPVMLHTADGAQWEGSTTLPDAPAGKPFTYSYGVFRDGQCIRRESGHTSHSFCPGTAQGARYLLHDVWRDLPRASYLYSSAFSGQYEAPKASDIASAAREGLTIRALCPCLGHANQVPGLVGKGKALGNWDGRHPVVMHQVQPNEWEITLDAHELEYPMEYKFVAVSRQHQQAVEWEEGSNRTLQLPMLRYGETWVMPEQEVYFGRTDHKLAGTAIPVFALRSEGSFGVGDFGDLTLMIDWCVATHQQALQILPINDTTITGKWTDSYPYNSISIYAFHPMYVDLRQLGKLHDKQKAAGYEAERRRLNALPQIDYEAVNTAKRAYLRDMYKQEGEKVLATKQFRTFFAENQHWLQPYAAFSYLRDCYGTPDFSQWPAEYSTYDATRIASLCSPDSKQYEEIAFHYYVQYQLHVQLLAASAHARRNGVIFKGDIPIGISRHSVEAWIEPYYFNMNGQAGAPPDAFSVNGQNWGFPTYNWDVMEQDGYQWWCRRFRKMAEYFTAYRIDHILGFFRIWEIPTHSVHGLLGQFSPALPMSPEEIGSFGLHFQREFMTRPFINEELIARRFGSRAQMVKDTYLVNTHDDIYEMRPEYDTQRKVEAAFRGLTSEDDVNLREGLYTLISDVLFVPDRKNPSMYHPRIAVQGDYIYERLSWDEKEAFNRLYNHYFYQRHNQFWYQEAMKKLPILTQSTPMLVCGEDLGMVPDCVPWVMDQLQILSLEIQRMPKNPEHEFGHVWEYPHRSVCTISTHDMSTLRGWWQEDEALTGRFFHNELGHSEPTPAKAPGSVCEEVVRRHLESPSMLCILAFQDWLGIDEQLRYPDADFERINVPANPRHYWRYRMHLTLEELMQQHAFNTHLRTLIDETARY
jgi:4-alpha-glucanotransferase